MDVVVTSPDGRDLAQTSDFSLDLSFGVTGNTFALSCPSLDGVIGRGCYVSVDGTEYGGVVDTCEVDVSGGVTAMTWGGRTWHGILAGKVLRPDAGSDYLEAHGDASAALADALGRCSLSGVIDADASPSGIRVDYRYERFASAYAGLRAMLASAGARLAIERRDGATVASAAPVADLGGVDSDAIDFRARRDYRPTNHLVCAGEGQLRDRVVVDLYADASGAVSRTQTLFGVDEVAEYYDNSNSTEDKLIEYGTDKLRKYQTAGRVDVQVEDGMELYVGDVCRASDRRSGLSVVAHVTKKVVKVSAGVASVKYEAE